MNLSYSKLAMAGLLSGVAIAANFAPAQAQQYATNVEFYAPGQGNIAGYRQTEANALGAPQADATPDFLSLGMGGSAIFSFATEENLEGYFQGSITVWETTWGHKSNQNSYDERIAISVGNDLNDVANWLQVGEIWNIRDRAYDDNQRDGLAGPGATIQIGNDNLYKYVLVQDLSKQRGDGFDVNAIAVNPAQQSPESVPEPATLLGGLAAMSMMAKLRRDRQS